MATLRVGAGLTFNGITGDVNFTGIVTATSFSGSGANLTGVAATSNISTNAIVNSGVTTVAAGSAAAPSISPTGDSNTGIFFPAADTIAIAEGGAEAARIDSSGRLLLGTSTAPSAGNAQYSKLVVQANTFAATDYGILNLQRGQAASGGITGNLGGIHFSDNTGNEFGLIQCAADGTTSAGDYPGRLYFSTTADGAASPTEAMRINNQRELLIGTTTRTANGGVLQVSNGITFPATQSACSDANTLDDYEEGTWTPTLGGNATYSVQTGTYTKIGRFIYASAMITVNTLGTGTNREIAGLPFNINLSNNDIGAVIGYVNACASNYIQISAGSYITSIVLACKTTASTDQGSAAVFQNGTAVRVTFTYFT